MLKEVIQLNGRVPAVQGHMHFYSNQLDVLQKIIILQNWQAMTTNHTLVGELLSDFMSCILNPSDAEAISNDTSVVFPLVPRFRPLHRVQLYI